MINVARVLVVASALAACTAALLPSSGYGATTAGVTIGSNLNHAPNSSSCTGATCTLANSALASGAITLDGFSAPWDGVIVRWRFAHDSLPGLVAVALRVFDGATPVLTGDQTFTFNASPGQELAGARMPIRAGQTLGMQVQAIGPFTGLYQAAGAGAFSMWQPPLTDNSTTAATSSSADLELLLQADIEHDVDGDGYGDATQDECPSDASTYGPCPPPAPQPPPPSFALLTAPAPSSLGYSGATSSFLFSLDVAATVSIIVQRKVIGHRAKGKCSARATNGKRCTAFKTVGTLTFQGSAGGNTLNFSNKVGKKKLTRGKYRAVITAKGGNGLVSAPQTISFSISK